MQPLFYAFNDTILFIGPIPPNDWHPIPVETLATNLNNHFNVWKLDGSTRPATSLYWPSSVVRKTSYKKGDLLAFFMFPNYLPVAQITRYKMQQRFETIDAWHQIENESAWVKLLNRIYLEKPEADTAKAWLNNFLNNSEHCLFSLTEKSIDTRIYQAITLIKEQIVYGSDIELAEQFNLSEQHLRRLFKKEVGTSISNYKIHLQILFMAILKSQGHTLTASSNGVGFYDLAHVDKRHKRIYGISASHTIIKSEIKVDSSLSMDSFAKQIK